MDREQQIAEMAKIIHKGELDRNKGVLDCTEFATDLVIRLGLQRLAGAKALFNAGYRKQSEVAREIFEKIENCMSCFEDDDDGYLLKKCEFKFFMRELKKEYTEESVNDR